MVEEIWVNTKEGAEITGYNREHLKRLVSKIWQQPEEERPVKMRKRSNGYDMWLPDLMAYLESTGKKPYRKRSAKE